MPPDSQPAADQIRADLRAAHAAQFGTRADQDLDGLFDTTAQFVALVLSHSLDAYASEPDFITGSSEKERSA